MKWTLLPLAFLGLNLTATPSKAAQVIRFDTMKAPGESSTAPFSFDESVNRAPNFFSSQIDADLKAAPKGQVSQLCAPASLAHIMAYEMGIKHGLPISTKVPGVASDLKSIDLNPLILDLGKRCKTDPKKGTTLANFVPCITNAFQDYFGTNVPVTSIVKSPTPAAFPSSVKWRNEDPSLTDIREALKNGDPVLASVDWQKYDRATKKWTFIAGHIFVLYGYNWVSYWKDNTLSLNIMNPLTDPSNNDSVADFDTVLAFKKSQDSSNDSILLESSAGFDGAAARGFLRSLTILHLPQGLADRGR